jgi:hypothetical protein
MLHKIVNNSSLILISSVCVVNIVLCYKNNKDSAKNTIDNIQNNLSGKYFLNDLIVSKKDFEKIKALPEIYTSSKNTDFHNVFFEKYLKYYNRTYSPEKYYNVFSQLQSNGFVDNNCELLKDWIDCYSFINVETKTNKRIAFISDGNRCSIKVY